MGKIAFVFSGQGDQYSGMGKELANNYPAAAEIFDICDSIRANTSKQCFEGSEAELKETSNTQPCIFAMELAALAVLNENNIFPSAVAGFSLGEVAAATAAGIFDTETGFKLVCRRGELMQQTADKYDTFMAAVVKLSDEAVENICSNFKDIYPVNYNCPGQVTVSGLATQSGEFAAAVKAAGGRAIPIKVKGAFHSPFMNEASEQFAKSLAAASISKAKTILYSNVTAQPYTDNVVELLSKQICNPVRWERIIRNMTADGIDTFIEIGPGKTLINMIKKIVPTVKVYSICELSVVLSEVNSC